jgi:hypothetical protein
MTRDLIAEAAGWHRHATTLAAFVFDRLPNRADVWGAYITPARRPPERPFTWTAPAKTRRGEVHLSTLQLVRHFTARDGGDVIGLHSTSPEETCRWLGLDFDVHPEDMDAGDVETLREQVSAGFAWCVDALGERVSLLLEDSNGRGGRHLWAYFDEPVSSPALFVWLSVIAADCRTATGYTPELRPAQARLPLDKEGRTKFGNWLRLPGLHHTRAHWSRLALAGEDWQSGAEAAATLLRWPATPANVVPPLDSWPVPETVTAPMRVSARRVIGEKPNHRAVRIERYVEKLPHAIAGTGRSNHLYRLACFLRHDMQCSSAEALPVLHAWNAGNAPPLSSSKVEDTWANAAEYGGRHAA